MKSLVEIRLINKSVIVNQWNKEEGYKSSRYINYTIKNNEHGIYLIPYYSIIINAELGDFVIYIPTYEVDTFVKLTHLKVIDDVK